MSRATSALLATIDAIEDHGAASEGASVDLPGESLAEPHPEELTTWIDTIALTLAAGIRVGARQLSQRPVVANDEAADVDAAGDVLTVDEVAALLKVGRNAVYEAVGRNEIPHRRIGKQIRFSRRALVSWFDSWSSQGAKEGK